jgi:hypothetical protein
MLDLVDKSTMTDTMELADSQTASPADVVKATFIPTAEAIVRSACDKLSRLMEEDQKAAIKKLGRTDLESVIDTLVDSFFVRKMGHKELEAAAKRELAIRIIRLTVDRYREGLLAGNILPTEYFQRFYLRHFLAGGLPANAICVVDPNLHRVAKKKGTYPQITKSFPDAPTTKRGRAPKEVSPC